MKKSHKNHIEKEGIIMRKKMMKRIGSWGLALSLCLGLMGCAASGPEATDPSGTTGPAAAVSANDPGKATEPAEHRETYKEVVARICRETNERNAAAKAEREAAAAEGSTETTAPGMENTGNTGTSGNQGSGSTGSQGGSSSGNPGGTSGSTQPTTPPATERPTEPKPTEPPATTAPTEPPAPTECAHNWQYDFTPEEGHYIRGVRCVCGAIFSTDDEWWSHVKGYDNLEAVTNHGSYAEYSEWIVEVPFSEWWYCTKCGATSSTNPNP